MKYNITEIFNSDLTYEDIRRLVNKKLCTIIEETEFDGGDNYIE